MRIIKNFWIVIFATFSLFSWSDCQPLRLHSNFPSKEPWQQQALTLPSLFVHPWIKHLRRSVSEGYRRVLQEEKGNWALLALAPKRAGDSVRMDSSLTALTDTLRKFINGPWGMYLRAIKLALGKGAGGVWVYLASGADISSLLLATNADVAYLYDTQRYVDYRAGERVEDLQAYGKKKTFRSVDHHGGPNLLKGGIFGNQSPGGLRPYLLAELFALGVTEVREEQVDERRVQLTFQWAYPGEHPRKRVVIFYQAHVSRRDILYPRSIDGIFEKLFPVFGELHAARNRLLRENLKRGGHFIHDVDFQGPSGYLGQWQAIEPSAARAFEDGTLWEGERVAMRFGKNRVQLWKKLGGTPVYRLSDGRLLAQM